jgi:hypothetical protein
MKLSLYATGNREQKLLECGTPFTFYLFEFVEITSFNKFRSPSSGLHYKSCNITGIGNILGFWMDPFFYINELHLLKLKKR